MSISVPYSFKEKSIASSKGKVLTSPNGSSDAFDRFSPKEEFCYFIKITCNYPIVDESKLPSEAELETFDRLNRTIEEALKAKNIKNYYVFRSTHIGERNLFIATNNEEASNKIMKSFKKPQRYFHLNMRLLKTKNGRSMDLLKNPRHNLKQINYVHTVRK